MACWKLSFHAVVLAVGCSGNPEPAPDAGPAAGVGMSDPSTAQYRAFAESYILRCIDRFDAAARPRLMEACAGAPYESADAALDDFEQSESVTAAQVEWIRDTWDERQQRDPPQDPRAFATEVAGEVFHEVEF
jgi:hypothetical protein